MSTNDDTAHSTPANEDARPAGDHFFPRTPGRPIPAMMSDDDVIKLEVT